MKKAILRREKMTIPTYKAGKEEKLPMFFEKRVYQGSSGRVYPNPVTEKISDKKTDCEYDAVILENDYIYTVVLPELGGRIYTAYDKSNGYDFIYHNHVIKPALVGLLGPWISGGIEFNWPQHHRPSTFKKVNSRTFEYADGSVSVFVGEVENMFGLEQTAEIRLYPDKAFIEISVRIFNRSDMEQTFLWWANPAYKVNENTATVMPPDVTAVMDHGKRAVSAYPIATGEYYKMNYSPGTDISRYKNIPVPTSFMAYKSDFDFVGGYDFGKDAGVYHFADHHISPGKKQWTWGCGGFGRAWDRNLTDEDGPYVELMTGCFTDNQPDFTFIRPGEVKTFTQYFMPYRGVGYIKNANRDFCLNNENGRLKIHCTGNYKGVRIRATRKEEILFERTEDFTPFTRFVCDVPENAAIEIEYADGKLRYDAAEVKKFPLPMPAEAIPEPERAESTEELYLYGLHIEQYRHATRLPEDYYWEGLRRDPSDLRLNDAYGALLLRRGAFAESKKYFRKSVEKLTLKNPNPLTTEPFFHLATAQMYLEEFDDAYDNFYKCIWSNENKSAAFYYLALIDLRRGDLIKAKGHVGECLSYNARNIKALNLSGRISVRSGRRAEALAAFEAAEKADPLDFASRFEKALLSAGKDGGDEKADGRSDGIEEATGYEITDIAKEYLLSGETDMARRLLERYLCKKGKACPVVYYYLGYALLMLGKDCSGPVRAAERNKDMIYFPNRLYDIVVLRALKKACPDYYVEYCLGNVYYDKRQYAAAAEYWLSAAEKQPGFSPVKRNLALYYYNRERDSKRAEKYLKSAYADDRSDGRIMMELFQLYRRMDKDESFLLDFLSENAETAFGRDDLWLEYISLVCDREPARAEKLLLSRRLHPWEGGEGKALKLYKKIKLSLYREAKARGAYKEGLERLREALVCPEELGEDRLILDKDNDLHYHLGEAYELCGDKAAATAEYALAAQGSSEIADDVYYNDSPVEYVYYIAKACKKLGDARRAEEIAAALREYAARNRSAKKKLDYFAVSLPDLLIWDDDLDERNRRFCDRLEKLAREI